MKATARKLLLVGALLTPLAIGGCASQGEVDQLRSDLSKAQAAADAAQAEARAAKAEAEAAKAEAAAANARADAATKAAADVSRKADKMYDRSLRK